MVSLSGNNVVDTVGVTSDTNVVISGSALV